MVTIWDIFAFLGISYSFAVVSLGAMIIGFMSGVLSVLFVNQRRSIIGDTIAHTTLPGIALAFLVVQDKQRLSLMIGAILTSILAVLFIQLITTKSSLKQDVAIGISMSFFVGIGIALLTYIQTLPLAAKAGLTEYMFGNLTFLLRRELRLIFILASLVLFVLAVFYKEYKLILFDREYAIILGLPVAKLESLLLLLVAFAIVLSIENMGVLLIAGLLIGPAIAARYWSNNYFTVLILAGMIGSLSGLFGVYSSSQMANTPPGPAIILVLSVIIIGSLVFGSANGLLRSWMHNRIFHRRIDHAVVLRKFIDGANGLLQVNGLRILEFDLQDYPDLDQEVVNALCSCGYCRKLSESKFTLTYKGVKATQKVISR